MTDPCACHGSPPGEVEIRFVRLDPDLPAPAYAHPGDAGADLAASVDALIGPGERVLVPTGIALALPEGYAGFVHPRSGLAARHGITVLNAPGTIDAGYRGEILVNLVNLDPTESFSVRRGDRIAQLVVQQVARAAFSVVESLESPAALTSLDSPGGTSRGDTGHGSTGGFATAPSPEARTEPSTHQRTE